jgi:hypothetical protein
MSSCSRGCASQAAASSTSAAAAAAAAFWDVQSVLVVHRVPRPPACVRMQWLVLSEDGCVGSSIYTHVCLTHLLAANICVVHYISISIYLYLYV